jgi:hypothetical protein
MFVAHEAVVEGRYEVVVARLVHLVNWGALHGVSEAAYEGGQEAVLRVGPFGGAPGLSKLVQVRALDPVRRGGTTTVPLRWEATGVASELFPVLDADLVLAGDGDNHTRLALVGTYRPPFGKAGAALDTVVLGRVATATIRSLLERVAAAVADPAPDPYPDAETRPRWWIVTELGEV